jgi:sugar/nucleoside kinase (ribokinase family)
MKLEITIGIWRFSTNVAMNSTRLGLNATMVAAVGDDGFGSYISETLGCWV